MGVLSNLTDEYFGDRVREEDVVFRYSIDSDNPPQHKLTPDEESFLRALARYTLFLDKSLFFQIENLQQHTKLVLSGARIMISEYPNSKELEREIKELKNLIEELGQEDWKLKKQLEERLKDLNEALIDEKYGIKATMLLGKYRHNNGYDSEVLLYVNNIEDCTGKDPVKTMYLMGQVLLHEYFHSFYYHVGVGSRDRINCVEEPMAEYGSLVVLDSVVSSGLPISTEASKTLAYTYNKVKRKQMCKGYIAAYGFGAYLYDNHRKDYRELIAEYANVSRLLDAHGRRTLEYKYMVYPSYPDSHFEKFTYDKLRCLLATGIKSAKGIKTLTKKVSKVAPVITHTSATGGSKGSIAEKKLCQFALEVFRFLKNKGLLGYLESFVTKKRNPELRTLTEHGVFKLVGILNDGSRISRSSDWFLSETFNIGSETYYLSTQWSEVNTNTHLHFDDLKKMIGYIYPKKFDIRKKDDMFIMIEL